MNGIKEQDIQNRNKTRIMFCSGHWLTGGMERKMSILFKVLKNHYDLHLLIVAGGNSVIDIPREVTKIVISEKHYNERYSDIALDEAKKHNIDIVVGVMDMFYGQLDLYEKCRQNHIKTIVSNSEYFFYPYYHDYFFNIAKRRLEVLKLVDAVLWQTNFTAAVYGHINSNGFVVPNPKMFERQHCLAKKNDKVIICVARFNDYIKRVDRMLACFKKVLEKEPEAKLWLVGQCNRTAKIVRLGNRSINDMMKEQQLNSSQVVFFGEVESVAEYYKRASVLLLTSESESFCNVINEAASFGLPIVYNEIPGLEDLIIDGCNGYMSPQDDIDTLASNICKILSDKKLRNKLGLYASKYAERFSVEKTVDKWKKVIDAVAQSDSADDLKNLLGSELLYKIENYDYFCTILTREFLKAFDLLYQNYSVVGNQLSEAKKDLNVAKRQLKDVNNQLEYTTNQYHKVINSRAWKAVTSFRKVKSAIIKH